MKSRIAVRVLSLGCLLIALIALAAKVKPEDAAQAATQQWLAQLDTGKYDETWTQLARPFRKEVKKRDWRKTMAQLRTPLGKVVSRTLKSAEFTKELPGAPEGEYVVIKYDTVFQNRSNVVEVITPALEADLTWRVAGYSIK